MKTTIRLSAIFGFALTAILLNSCSNETPALPAKSDITKVEEEAPKQQSPQLLVQQFGGCKAHR